MQKHNVFSYVCLINLDLNVHCYCFQSHSQTANDACFCVLQYVSHGVVALACRALLLTQSTSEGGVAVAAPLTLQGCPLWEHTKVRVESACGRQQRAILLQKSER